MSVSCSATPEARTSVPRAAHGGDALNGRPTERPAAAALRREEETSVEPQVHEDAPPGFVTLSLPAFPAYVDSPADAAANSTGLCDASDAGAFVREMSGAGSAESGEALDPLARGLTDLIDEGRVAAKASFEFDIDTPGLGLLQGRVSISNGQADLELRACRPASAAALRARQSELQRLIDRESDGDVSLFIV